MRDISRKNKEKEIVREMSPLCREHEFSQGDWQISLAPYQCIHRGHTHTCSTSELRSANTPFQRLANGFHVLQRA